MPLGSENVPSWVPTIDELHAACVSGNHLRMEDAKAIRALVASRAPKVADVPTFEEVAACMEDAGHLYDADYKNLRNMLEHRASPARESSPAASGEVSRARAFFDAAMDLGAHAHFTHDCCKGCRELSERLNVARDSSAASLCTHDGNRFMRIEDQVWRCSKCEAPADYPVRDSSAAESGRAVSYVVGIDFGVAEENSIVLTSVDGEGNITVMSEDVEIVLDGDTVKVGDLVARVRARMDTEAAPAAASDPREAVLKACPCGGEAKIQDTFDYQGNYIICLRLGCYMKTETVLHKDRQLLIDSWNTRPSAPHAAREYREGLTAARDRLLALGSERSVHPEWAKTCVRVIDEMIAAERAAPSAQAVEPGPRVETGVVQFDDDWPGVFIRGDNAVQYGLRLTQALKDLGDRYDTGGLRYLSEILVSCDTRNGGRENARKLSTSSSPARLRAMLERVEELPEVFDAACAANYQGYFDDMKFTPCPWSKANDDLKRPWIAATKSALLALSRGNGGAK